MHGEPEAALQGDGLRQNGDELGIVPGDEVRQHGDAGAFPRHLPLGDDGRAAEARRQARRDVFMIAQLGGIDQVVDIADEVMLREVGDGGDRARAGEIVRMGVEVQHIVRQFAHFQPAGFRPRQHDRHVRLALRHGDEAGDGDDVEPHMRRLNGEAGHGRRQ